MNIINSIVERPENDEDRNKVDDGLPFDPLKVISADSIIQTLEYVKKEMYQKKDPSLKASEEIAKKLDLHAYVNWDATVKLNAARSLQNDPEVDKSALSKEDIVRRIFDSSFELEPDKENLYLAINFIAKEKKTQENKEGLIAFLKIELQMLEKASLLENTYDPRRIQAAISTLKSVIGYYEKPEKSSEKPSNKRPHSRPANSDPKRRIRNSNLPLVEIEDDEEF